MEEKKCICASAVLDAYGNIKDFKLETERGYNTKRKEIYREILQDIGNDLGAVKKDCGIETEETIEALEQANELFVSGTELEATKKISFALSILGGQVRRCAHKEELESKK